MKLSEMKNHLTSADDVNFKLPTGAYIPAHFHITEVGLVTKHFIDCGGKECYEKTANLQLWYAQDLEHRLTPQKLLNIIHLSEEKLGIGNIKIEVEYQSETIGKYGLHYNGKDFELTPKHTACLAAENCGIPTQKQKLNLAELQPAKEACCTPGGGCC